MVIRYDRGTLDWTAAQKRELIATGRVREFDGHHINSVNGNVGLAGNPDNISFMPDKMHTELHLENGGYKGPTSGQLLDRSKFGAPGKDVMDLKQGFWESLEEAAERSNVQRLQDMSRDLAVIGGAMEVMDALDWSSIFTDPNKAY